MVPLSGSPGWIEQGLNLAILAALVLPFGAYMADVFRNRKTALSFALDPVERAALGLAGVKADRSMDWRTYALSALSFSSLVFLALYIALACTGLPAERAFILAVQLAADPAHAPAGPMAAATAAGFVSTGTGLAVFMATVRGLSGLRVGNFWADLVRAELRVVLPVSIAFAALVATAGAGEALEAFGRAHVADTVPHLPSIADEARHLFTTPSGAVVNAAAVQFAATPSTRLLALLSGALIPLGLGYSFGLLTGDRLQGALMLGATALVLMSGHAAGPAVSCGLVAVFMLVTAVISRLRTGQATYLNRRLGRYEVSMAMACLGLIVVAPLTALVPALSLIALPARLWTLIPALAFAGSLSNRPAGAQG
ncbi:potassium-transporting ATPase subunit KdpA [Asticcacaulis solisilvae]|uniref:potassium-transporting ATPase subunit KdpA n=1 Tax=Asticcacaulis solisilvae TaxID=1217274 RepID=UPI003FD77E6F